MNPISDNARKWWDCAIGRFWVAEFSLITVWADELARTMPGARAVAKRRRLVLQTGADLQRRHRRGLPRAVNYDHNFTGMSRFSTLADIVMVSPGCRDVDKFGSAPSGERDTQGWSLPVGRSTG